MKTINGILFSFFVAYCSTFGAGTNFMPVQVDLNTGDFDHVPGGVTSNWRDLQKAGTNSPTLIEFYDSNTTVRIWIETLQGSSHDRKHGIDGTDDHNGVAGAVENNIMVFDANGLPKDSGFVGHAQLHGIDAGADHNGVAGAVENNIMVFDANGLPKDSGFVGHAQLHGIDAGADHNGVAGAVENNAVAFDANGLPKDSGFVAHAQLHGIDDGADHNGVAGAVENNMVVFDANGLPKDGGFVAHAQLHGIDDGADHDGVAAAVENNIVVFDANGLPKDGGDSITGLRGYTDNATNPLVRNVYLEPPAGATGSVSRSGQDISITFPAGGAGDMLKATYDPAGGASQVAFESGLASVSNNWQSSNLVLQIQIVGVSNFVITVTNILHLKVDAQSNWVVVVSNQLWTGVLAVSNSLNLTNAFLVSLNAATSNYVASSTNLAWAGITATSNSLNQTNAFLVSLIAATSNYVASSTNLAWAGIVATSNSLDQTNAFLVSQIAATSNYVASSTNLAWAGIIGVSNFAVSVSNNIMAYLVDGTNILHLKMGAQSNWVVVVSNQLWTGILATSNDSARTTLNNLGTTAVNAHVIPDTDDTRNLGSGAKQWATIYATGLALDGSILSSTGIDILDTMQNAWSGYAPSWTGITVGNGTSVGRYMAIGKLVFFRASFVLGSTSAVTGAITLSLPVAKESYSANMGLVTLYDDSASTGYPGVINQAGSVRVLKVDGTYATPAQLSSTVPFTWTTSDAIYIQGFYEAD